MGHQIIKQPDGRFVIFSSITDTIIVYDAFAAEIVEYFAEKAAEDARRQVRRILDAVSEDRPREAYYQFTLTWAEALEMDERHGGEAWQLFAARSSDGSEPLRPE
jgi:hypothetical protein